jgi:hypothetical protein
VLQQQFGFEMRKRTGIIALLQFKILSLTRETRMISHVQQKATVAVAGYVQRFSALFSDQGCF